MNYLILKSIIDATVVNFRCKECDTGIQEGNINLLGIAGNSINMEVVCPNCRTAGVVKAEIGFMNQNATPDMLNNLKNTMQSIRGSENPAIDEKTINDSDILSVRDGLKKCSSIEDLFKM